LLHLSRHRDFLRRFLNDHAKKEAKSINNHRTGEVYGSIEFCGVTLKIIDHAGGSKTNID
ncbi:MAG: hypothetical protein ACTSRA_09575, partial [Promethearchaeota archaeon]